MTFRTRKPTLVVPEKCSSQYADGWLYADWQLSIGYSPDVNSPDGLSEEIIA